MNKKGIHITTDRESKELSVDVKEFSTLKALLLLKDGSIKKHI